MLVKKCLLKTLCEILTKLPNRRGILWAKRRRKGEGGPDKNNPGNFVYFFCLSFRGVCRYNKNVCRSTVLSGGKMQKIRPGGLSAGPRYGGRNNGKNDWYGIPGRARAHHPRR